MKEYALFVQFNGDAELYCGGQFAFFAREGSTAASVAKLWSLLDEAGERLVEIRETGIDRGEARTFVVKTLPKGTLTLEPVCMQETWKM